MGSVIISTVALLVIWLIVMAILTITDARAEAKMRLRKDSYKQIIGDISEDRNGKI